MSEQKDNSSPKDGSAEEEQMMGYVKRRPIRRKPTEPKPTVKSENKVVKMLDKNPLGLTLPEMAGGTRKIKRLRTLRPMLSEAIKLGIVMPVSQRSGHTVYRLVKHMKMK